MKQLVILIFLFISLDSYSQKVSDRAAILHLKEGSSQKLNKNLFGHFLEKCNWNGETGADLIWDNQKNDFRADVVELIDSLHPPIIRFPGGTDIDYYQWTDLIDNAYDRKNPERPPYKGRSGNIVSHNEFGIDEFLTFSENLNFEPLLVINLGDAYFEKESLQDATEYAAAFVAYCNARVDASLPEKYLKWARLRMQNGRKEPYHVKYFQIGNEVWVFNEEELSREGTIEKKVVDRYYDIVSAYIDEIKSVDRKVKIIIEGNLVDFIKPAKERLGDKFDLMAYHHYTPWGMNDAINAQGDTVNNITKEDFYYACVSVPGFNKKTGESDIDDIVFKTLLDNNVPIAMTEWNWNGWVGGGLKDNGHKDSQLAQGLGAASYLHAMMRHAGVIALANQSMLVGNSWGINSIRVDKETDEATTFPTGMVTGMYSRYHGDKVLESTLTNNEFYDQIYTIAGISPRSNISYLDVVVTESVNKLFIHVINRDYAMQRKLQLDLQNLSTFSDEVKHIALTGSVYARGKPESADVNLTETSIKMKMYLPTLTIEPHSVNVFVFQKKIK